MTITLPSALKLLSALLLLPLATAPIHAKDWAKARLDAGAGTQLDVLNSQVQLTTAQSTRLQALFGYNSALAEFDRVTGAQSTYTESFNSIAPRAARSKIYDTGSGATATGKRRENSSK